MTRWWLSSLSPDPVLLPLAPPLSLYSSSTDWCAMNSERPNTRYVHGSHQRVSSWRTMWNSLDVGERKTVPPGRVRKYTPSFFRYGDSRFLAAQLLIDDVRSEKSPLKILAKYVGMKRRVHKMVLLWSIGRFCKTVWVLFFCSDDQSITMTCDLHFLRKFSFPVTISR